MPSLHLDIPSIDWIARPPRAERTDHGKPHPVEEAGVPAPKRERAKRPPAGDTHGQDPWPGRPVGVPA